MREDRRLPSLVGILYIIGTVAGVLSLAVAGNIINGSDYLAIMSVNSGKVIAGAILMLVMGISLSMIPVVLFPIFRKSNEALAMGAVVFRGAIELMVYMGIACGWLMLLSLSRSYTGMETGYGANYQLAGVLLHDVGSKLALMLDVAFSIGALFIYVLFRKTKLIPDWLSLWGIVGGSLYLSFPLLSLLGAEIPLLQLPLALQEMVMAVWLLTKGFSVKGTTNGSHAMKRANDRAYDR